MRNSFFALTIGWLCATAAQAQSNTPFGIPTGKVQQPSATIVAAPGAAVGGYQGILFTLDPALPVPVYSAGSIERDDPVNGVYRAGSDHRKDGQAVGW